MKFYVMVKEEDLEKINSDLNAGELKNSHKRPRKNLKIIKLENYKKFLEVTG